MSLNQAMRSAAEMYSQSKFDEADKLLSEYADQVDNNADYWCLYAGIKGLSGDMLTAEKYCRRAVEIAPDHALAYFRLGNIVDSLGKHADAIDIFDKSIALKPDFAHTWNNKGIALMSLSRPQDSETCFRQAISLEPNIVEFYVNTGLSFAAQAKLTEAISWFEKAVDKDPNHVEANWSLANAWLTLGDYKKGWDYYSWRWQRPGKLKHDSDKPQWTDESLDQKRLLIYLEQGFGDAIQYIRFLPALKQLGATTILQNNKPLHSLFESANGIDKLVTSIEAEDYDFHISIADLPSVFINKEEDIPTKTPYLIAPESDSVDIDKHSIGLVWAGNPNHANDFNRSCPLKVLDNSGLFKNEKFTFYSLQRDHMTSDDKTLLASNNITDLSGHLSTFGDTASIIQKMELVISIDTSVAHLAGALGARCWMLLPFLPDWRWQLDRQDSPWYPSIKLFRQQKISDWESVLTHIVSELENLD